MKFLFLFLFLVLIIPNFAFADWWNPKTWFAPASKSVPMPQLDQTIIPTSTKQTSKKQEESARLTSEQPEVIIKTVDNPVLLKRIKELEQEIASLKIQLSQVKTGGNITNTQQISVTVTDEVRKIKVKLAELDQLDWKIDNVQASPLLLEALNSITTLEGTKLFDANNNINLKSVNTGSNGIMTSFPEEYISHFIIDNYRQKLKLKLAEVE